MSFGPKTIEQATSYRYGAWAGNPNGRKYEASKCMEEVCESGRGALHYQCSRKIWKDGFCKQHHPATIEAKLSAREQKYQEERERDRKEFALQSAAPSLLDALKLAMECGEATGMDSAYPEAWEQMRAAISKAEG